MQNHKIRLVDNLSDVLTVRNIRNDCREYLTNNTDYIGILRQIWWYLTFYRRAVRNNKYRIFIARDSKNRPVGYGALLRQGGKLLVTECVSEIFRGQGYGQAILEKLINMAKREKLPLRAEIRDTNKISVALHEKYGFKLISTTQKQGFKLRIYEL